MLLFALNASGCAAEVMDSDDSARPEAVSFALMVQPLIDETCNCHQSAPILMAPFSLVPAEAYANLVGKPSSQVTTMALVSPGALNESYLWHKLSGTHLEVGGLGDRMPSNFPLDPNQLKVFEQWIASGADR
jgi:hypothetical protein